MAIYALIYVVVGQEGRQHHVSCCRISAGTVFGGLCCVRYIQHMRAHRSLLRFLDAPCSNFSRLCPLGVYGLELFMDIFGGIEALGGIEAFLSANTLQGHSGMFGTHLVC